MSEAAANTKVKATMIGHGITVDGRHVLLHAQGDLPFYLKLTARWNLRRWNKGKRTWLL